MASKKLFREYIGAGAGDVSFSDVPINPNVDFHFILSFAVDYTQTTTPYSPTNGNFIAYWDTGKLSPDAIAAFKKEHSNVKVALSIGGATIGVDAKQVEVFFETHDKESWVKNAVSSLTDIIQEYHLDGIDIDYENFSTNVETFAECMGHLITNLKDNGVIQFASIAPFRDTSAFYEQLWTDHKDHIDYVNYQFYELLLRQNEQDYLDDYNTQRNTFSETKLLASLSTSTEDPIPIAPDTAISACTTLKAQGKLFGIFIWSADDSFARGDFTYEKQAQELLANPPN